MLCIELIGQYRMTPNKRGRKHAMKDKKDKNFYLQVITMIDPAKNCSSNNYDRPR